MFGPCARRVVICTLVDTEGNHHVGENFCLNAQPTCPRKENEDYTKCQTVCRQLGHAETVAIIVAGERAMDARAYVEGHSYACRNCQESLYAAGVQSISVSEPPKEIK